MRMPKGRFANTAPFPHRGPWEKRGLLATKMALRHLVGTGTKVGHEAKFYKYCLQKCDKVCPIDLCQQKASKVLCPGEKAST